MDDPWSKALLGGSSGEGDPRPDHERSFPPASKSVITGTVGVEPGMPCDGLYREHRSPPAHDCPPSLPPQHPHHRQCGMLRLRHSGKQEGQPQLACQDLSRPGREAQRDARLQHGR